ncbi:MAG: hypothetical protein ACTSUG_12775 [Candidatus Helarchaeota archaeon]
MKNRYFLSFIIFFSIFLLLGLIYPKWGFESDDCGHIFHSKISSKKDLYYLLKGKDLYSLHYPSNFYFKQTRMTNVFYRPIQRLFMALQIPFFGIKPFGYFLVNIFLHAINSVILFYIFLSFSSSLILAFLMALFFGFHISLASWIGWIGAQHYVFCLFFLLLSLVTFFSFLKKKNISLYVLTGILYGLALFSFELIILFPLFISSFFIIKSFFQRYYSFFSKTFFEYQLNTSIFWIVASSYLLLRHCLYNLSTTGKSVFSLFSQFTHLLYASSATFIVEYANYPFIPSGNQLLKGSILIIIVGIFLWLFLKNKEKRAILFFFISFGIFVWPVFVKFYRSRYTYFSLPIFVFIIFLLLKSFFEKKSKGKLVITSIMIFIIGFNILYNIRYMKCRESSSGKYYYAFEELVKDNNIYGKIICFIGLPFDLGSSTAQAIWIRGVNKDLPIYYDTSTFVKAFSNKTDLFIKPIKKGFELLLSKEDGAVFNNEGGVAPMGRFINEDVVDNNTYLKKRVYILDDRYLNKNLFFITWNYHNNEFELLNKKPL